MLSWKHFYAILWVTATTIQVKTLAKFTTYVLIGTLSVNSLSEFENNFGKNITFIPKVSLINSKINYAKFISWFPALAFIKHLVLFEHSGQIVIRNKSTSYDEINKTWLKNSRENIYFQATKKYTWPNCIYYIFSNKLRICPLCSILGDALWYFLFRCNDLANLGGRGSPIPGSISGQREVKKNKKSKE